MVTENKVLMEKARHALSGNWGLGVGTMALYFAITIALNIVAGLLDKAIPFLGTLAIFIISGPLAVGICFLYIRIAKKEKDVLVQDMFEGFRNFWPTVGVYLLVVIKTLLWALLLIIPGIIASFRYAMALYVIAEKPQTSPSEAVEQSKAMMKGNKWKLFCLMLRFIGWLILCVLSLGIGFLWVGPYMYTSMALFYLDVKGSAK